jgi:hypothetical protein
MADIAGQLERAYQIVTAKLPPKMAASLDLKRPVLWSKSAEPMNGQVRRQAIVKELLSLFPFDEIVETGTFRGGTTEWFTKIADLPVESAETMLRFYLFAEKRLEHAKRVRLHLGDSRDLLQRLTKRPGEYCTFFYLDAHWGDEPRHNELELIRNHWKRAILMIDDFKIPGDEGYGFAYYSGRPLDESYLPNMAGWKLFYPAVRSQDETGARRGCAVLASPEFVDTVSQMSSLRPA